MIADGCSRCYTLNATQSSKHPQAQREQDEVFT
jgi:hypothetical protein